MEVTGTTDHDVSAIFFRIPVYGDRNLSIWFSQAESPFILSGVRTEQRKYHLVVSALSPAAGEEISDLLFGPPSTTSYSTLKAAVLERTTASQCSRIEELLSAEELGGRLPSQLHRHMRQLISSYTTTTEENLLRELFLQSLSAVRCCPSHSLHMGVHLCCEGRFEGLKPRHTTSPGLAHTSAR
ncbi:hypothetical protein HPB51_000349 [Rhipicephalus microplus]|uniref:DUF7041 domain-containing protein n=1 Tax=Rhipicephalus microplus TaxID=6941 RepID=A0A9J6D349_RHIMP|nr:hypothetical protein HPB51_000349 [Rhipicephalus microplus]